MGWHRNKMHAYKGYEIGGLIEGTQPLDLTDPKMKKIIDAIMADSGGDSKAYMDSGGDAGLDFTDDLSKRTSSGSEGGGGGALGFSKGGKVRKTLPAKKGKR
jgi:hypothetical protein